MTKRIGILTGGGDCPGLNAAIRAVVRSAENRGIEVFGIEQGFLGFQNNKIHKFCRQDLSGIISRGGTILKSSRFNPYANAGALQKLKAQLKANKIEALVVIGGDGSLGIAKDLFEKDKIPTIGIPKTIDNDVYGTESIGFDTAVQTAMENIDRLQSTAESHNMIMLVEVMGRHSGALAAHAGLAGGAEFILVPERKSHIKDLVKQIKARHKAGRNHSVIVVAEDAKIYDESGEILAQTTTLEDQYGKQKLGGVVWRIREILEPHLDYEMRCVVLGHVQRGGSPTAQDRFMATLMGHEAVEQISQKNFGKLIAFERGSIRVKDLSVVRKGKKQLSPKVFDVAQTYFG